MLAGGVNGFQRFLTSHSRASQGWPPSFLLPISPHLSGGARTRQEQRLSLSPAETLRSDSWLGGEVDAIGGNSAGK